MKTKDIVKILILFLLFCFLGDIFFEDLNFPTEALCMEALVSIPMSIFILIPIAKTFTDNYKKLFLGLFIIRAVFLLLFDFYVSPVVAIYDFMITFVGIFLGIPVVFFVKAVWSKYEKATTKDLEREEAAKQILDSFFEKMHKSILKCPKCDREMPLGKERCSVCGTDLVEVLVTRNTSKKGSQATALSAFTGVPFRKDEYDPVFFQTEKRIALASISKLLKENSVSSKLRIPEIEKRKNIFTGIYLTIVFVLACIFFFYHVVDYVVALFVVATIVYVLLSLKYNVKSYLLREVQSRPKEKINYVVSSVLSGKATTYRISPAFGRLVIFCGVFLMLCSFFWEPHMIFEQTEGGYAIRYYTIGISKRNSIISIPSKYRGEDVVSIRGNVFKNLWFIENVEIPDTVTEIRGGAFQDCVRLREVNLPAHITEVKGSTFENCYSLESIVIPEGVTRIGGSAFRNCSSLNSAVVPKTVLEIGSSAFRGTAIDKVCISNRADVNERAFKETYAKITYYENGCVDNYEYDSGY